MPEPSQRSPLALHSASPRELKEQIEAAQLGVPLVVYRNGEGAQQVLPLREDRLTIGRDEGTDVPLSWDPEVSRVHAELVRVGRRWALLDDGLSRNGSFVNGERVAGRRVLEDGDIIRLGATPIGFRDQAPAANVTVASGDELTAGELSATQRQILKTLCVPLLRSGGFAAPASNQQIAEELVLSVDAVKKQLRSLFHKFGVDDLPQNQKRARLAELALQSGLASPRDAG